MKPTIITVFVIILIIACIGCFIGGVVYASKTSGFPKDGYFEIDGYFTNLRKAELKMFDYSNYSRFEIEFGANEQAAKDYNENPQNYVAYEADLYMKNKSNYEIISVWPVLPETKFVNYQTYIKESADVQDRTIWLHCTLGAAVASLSVSNREHNYTLYFIVKVDGRTDEEIEEVLKNTKVNLQSQISQTSLNPQYDISTTNFFFSPVYYQD